MREVIPARVLLAMGESTVKMVFENTKKSPSDLYLSFKFCDTVWLSEEAFTAVESKISRLSTDVSIILPEHESGYVICGEHR